MSQAKSSISRLSRDFARARFLDIIYRASNLRFRGASYPSFTFSQFQKVPPYDHFRHQVVVVLASHLVSFSCRFRAILESFDIILVSF